MITFFSGLVVDPVACLYGIIVLLFVLKTKLEPKLYQISLFPEF